MQNSWARGILLNFPRHMPLSTQLSQWIRSSRRAEQEWAQAGDYREPGKESLHRLLATIENRLPESTDSLLEVGRQCAKETITCGTSALKQQDLIIQIGKHTLFN